MVFDGNPYNGARPVPALAYTSRYPFIPVVLANSLISGYFAARNNARLLCTYAFPWNGLNPTIDVVSRTSSSDPAQLGEFDLYVPENWTRAIGAMIFTGQIEGTTDGGAIPIAHHRLDADDGTTLKQGTLSSVELPSGAWSARGTTILDADQRNSDVTTFFDTFSVELSGLVLGDVIRFDVYGHIPTEYYQPVMVAIWLEA